MTPQLILTLDPQTGGLLAQLPGPENTQRTVAIRHDEAGDTLIRILKAQLESRTEIGLDGAPTQAQVTHWERHALWPSAKCRFCLAEGRCAKGTSEHKEARAKARVVSKDSGVEVRLLPAGKSFRHKTLDTKRSPEDIGL